MFSNAPILLGLALCRRRVRVLHLEPIGRTAAAVGRALALGHYAFEPKLAGMAKNDLAVLMLKVLILFCILRCVQRRTCL